MEPYVRKFDDESLSTLKPLTICTCLDMRADTHSGKHMIHRMKLTIRQSALTMHRPILRARHFSLRLHPPLSSFRSLLLPLHSLLPHDTIYRFCTIAPLDADMARDHVHRLLILFVNRFAWKYLKINQFFYLYNDLCSVLLKK